MKVKITELKSIALKAIKSYGYSQQEAKSVLDILMYAQLRGNNQGIVKLIGSGIPKRDGAKRPKIVKQTPVSALIKGNKTHAMVVMNMVTEIAIEKAKNSGIGLVGNFDTEESTGAIGYYVTKIARKGLIGIAFASAPFRTTAPYGSTEPLFCTNPMAYGIPTEKDPIVLDMSTSAIAYYGLVEAKTAKKNVAKDIGYDKNGKPTVKPEEIITGAIKTFAGYKGSGLALIVQIFASSLVNADYFDNKSDNGGNLIIAIDPKILVNKKEFIKSVTDMIRKIKKARKLSGVDEILIPGERGNKVAKKRIASGYIDVEDNLYSELRKVAGVK